MANLTHVFPNSTPRKSGWPHMALPRPCPDLPGLAPTFARTVPGLARACSNLARTVPGLAHPLRCPPIADFTKISKSHGRGCYFVANLTHVFSNSTSRKSGGRARPSKDFARALPGLAPTQPGPCQDFAHTCSDLCPDNAETSPGLCSDLILELFPDLA